MKLSLLLFSLLALCLSGAGAQSDHSAVTPVARGNEWWADRAELLNKRVAESPDTQLVFIGDSITQGWEGAGKAEWEKRYAGYDAVNLGIGGDRTQHVLYRLQNGNLEGIAPKVAVVMIGTNNSNGVDNTAAQIAEGVAAIVDTLRTRVPDTKILLLGIFPRGENVNDQRGKLLQINQILAKQQEIAHVHYLDIGHHFITSTGLIPAEIMPDYLHLSPRGYTIWADAIEPYLQSWLGPVAPSPLVGDWTFIIQGPNGEDREMALKIAQEDGAVTGSLGVGERQFALEKAAIEASSITFTVTRDRDNGGSMIYHLKGRLDAGKLSGTVTTEVEGEEIEREWRAHRSE